MTDQRRRRIVAALYVALLVLMAVAAGFHARKASDNRTAFLRWRPLLHELARGEDVYHRAGDYPSPPLLGLCLYPLALLPPMAGAMSLFFLKAVMAAAALRWSLLLAAGRGARVPLWASVLTVGLSLRPILSDLQHGNVNIVILFVATAGLWAYARGRVAWAGLAIALATAFKLTPALFIPYFAWKREWRVVAWSMAGLVLFLLVVPGIILGPRRNLELLDGWADKYVRPYVLRNEVETRQHNQSLPGVAYRLLTDSPGLELKDDEPVPINCASLDPGVVRWIVRALILALLGWLAWVSRTPATDHRDWRLAAEQALIFEAMLFISASSWKHHYVTMALPFAVVAAAIALRSSRRERIWNVTALVLCLAFWQSTSPAFGLDDSQLHKYAQAYGLFFLGALVIFAAISRLLIRSRGASPAVLDT